MTVAETAISTSIEIMTSTSEKPFSDGRIGA
jgi:hypothetical protein